VTMQWNNRFDRFELNGGHSGESFLAHTERMRTFRKSHGRILGVRLQRHDKPTYAEAMRAFCLSRDNAATMKSRSLGGTAGPLALSLVRKVMLSMN
jgi:hypothetical protein